MQKRVRRFVSLFLAAVLLISGIPSSALAEAGMATTAPVTYRYQAKDAMGRVITDLPQEIMDTLPNPETKEVGDDVQPANPTKTSFDSKYKDREGHWSFKGWDRKSLSVTGNSDKDIFVGNWIFRDKGFGRSPYMGNQFIPVDLQKTMKVGKFYIELKLDSLEGVALPNPDPFSLPETYEIRRSLVGDPDERGHVRGRTVGERVATGKYKKDVHWSKWEKDATEGGYLIDSYGKAVTLPLFDENGVGIEYQVQNLDMPFHEDGKASNHHHRWWRLISIPGHAFERNQSTGENIMRLNNYEGYTELVSSEFRSTWLTSTPEAERPEIRAIIPSDDPDVVSVYVPLLKKNYKDNPDNFVRARVDGVNDSWLHNYIYDEAKEQFGLLDHYRDPYTGEEYSDLREKFPVGLEGIDQDGFIEKDGHRFKSSITYDIYKGAFATFQEEYTLTFHPEGGQFSDQTSSEKKFSILHGERLKESEAQQVQTPTCAPYVFKGWRIGQTDPLTLFDVKTAVTKNLDLYAVWEKPIVLKEEPKITDGSGQQKVDPDYRKVTFDPNGGAFGESNDALSYWILKNATFDQALKARDAEGNLLLTIPQASKENYNWLGWADQASKTAADVKKNLSDFKEDPTAQKDLTFYAIYQEQAKGTVNYVFTAKDAAGNKITTLPDELKDKLPEDTQSYYVGTKVSPQTLAETKVPGTHDGKAGKWIFDGWDPKELTIQETGNVFTGLWKFAINRYTLIFHPEGGNFSDLSVQKTYYVYHGDRLQYGSPEEPTRPYHVFKGWQVGKTTPAPRFVLSDPVTQDMEMYAVWEKKPMVVSTEPTVPDGSGQWKTDPEYRKVTFDPNTGAFGTSTSVVSYWILNDATFKEALDAKDTTGSKLLTIPQASKVDHDWLGWADQASKTAADFKKDLSDFTEDPTAQKEHIFYAIYKQQEGTVRYVFTAKDAKGNEVQTLPAELMALLPTDATSYLVGSSVTPKALTKTTVSGSYDGKEGSWTFTGWTPSTLTIQKGENIFTGTWSFVIKECKLTFHTEGGAFADGKTEKILPVSYGEQLPSTSVQDPIRPFYNFKGWRIGQADPVTPFDFTKAVTQDLNLYAMWEAKPIVVTQEPKVADGSGQQKADPDYRKVTFDPNGGAFGTSKEVVSYWILNNTTFAEALNAKDAEGNKLLTIPQASKENYNWLGWADQASKTAADFKKDLSDFTEDPTAQKDLTFYAIYKKKENKPVTPPINPGTDPDIPSDEPGKPPVIDREDGKDRIDTSIIASRKHFKQANTVIIVRNDLYPDALTASVLAKVKPAPILLTPSKMLDPRVEAEIRRLGATEIIIVGGKSAISLDVEKALAAYDSDTVERLDGIDRYETATLVARKVAGLVDIRRTAIITTGENWPDALSASAFACKNNHPILLVRKNKIDPVVNKTMKDLKIGQVYLVGGPMAVSEAVAKKLPKVITRIAGLNRYGTAKAVAEYGFKNAKGLYIASGEVFADALIIGPVAGMRNVPILLTSHQHLNAETKAYIEAHKPGWITLVGGALRIGPEVEKELKK